MREVGNIFHTNPPSSLTQDSTCTTAHYTHKRWVHNPALKPHFFHEDDDRPDKLANELRVAVIRARKLPIMDKNLFSKVRNEFHSTKAI